MSIVFIIPCHNEEASISSVITNLRQEVPDARIVVCDNASTDRTAEFALAAEAEVVYESQKGKGNAMRRLFRDIEADVYIMIDGDNTYGTDVIRDGLRLVMDRRYDMVVGLRRMQDIRQRRGHNFGNQLFTRFFRIVFGVQTDDVFSGLRILSRRLVKTFPCISLEFEIEAELEIYCARMHLPTAILPVSMRTRKDSTSKLNTLRDGFKILWLAIRMLHREYPLRFYAPLAALIFLVAILVLTPIILTYSATGLVPRIPTLVGAAAMVLLSFFSLGMGVILKEIANSRYENRYLRYLEVSSGKVLA